jgi:hypothetical protein
MPGPRFFNPEGKQLDEQEAEAALATGEVRAESGTVALRNAQGERIELDTAHGQALSDAIRNGYRIESPEERHQTELTQRARHAPVSAFAAGAANGLTMGASNVAVDKLGGGDLKAYFAALKAEHPTLDLAGQVAGGVAPLAAGGVGGVAGTVLRNTPAGLAMRAAETVGARTAAALSAKGVAPALAKVAGQIVEGTFDGGAQGFGQELGEQALGDAGYNGQKLVSGGAIGAALGFGTVGGLKLASKGARAIADKYAERAAAKAEREAATAAERETVAGAVEGGAVAADRAVEASNIADGPLTEAVGHKDAGGYKIVDWARDKFSKWSAPVSGASERDVRAILDEPGLRSDLLNAEQVRIAGGTKIREAFQPVLDNVALMREFSAGKTKASNIARHVNNSAEYVVRAGDESIKLLDGMAQRLEEMRPMLSSNQAQRIEANLSKTRADVLRGIGAEGSSRLPKLETAHLALEDLKRVSAGKRKDLESAKFGGSADKRDEINALKAFEAENEAQLRRHLEREDLWGKAGELQRKYNKSIADVLNSSDMFRREMLIDTGERLNEDDWWLKRQEMDGHKADSFLRGVNDERRSTQNRVVGEHLAQTEHYWEQVVKDGLAGEYAPRAEAAFLAAKEARKTFQETSTRLGKLEAAQGVIDANNHARSVFSNGLPQTGAVIGGFAGGPIGAGIGAGIGAAAQALSSPGAIGVGLAKLEALAQRVKGVGNTVESKTRSAVRSTLKAAAKPGLRSDVKRAAPIAATRIFGHDDTSRRTKVTAVQKRLEEYRSAPERLLQAVSYQTADLAQVAPAHAFQAIQTTMKGVQFLNSKLPKGPSIPNKLQPQLNKVPWTPQQIESFTRYASAVDKPETVLDDLKNGHLSKEQVEAVGAVYPDLLQEMRYHALDEISKHPDEIPYAATVNLGLLLGIETHPTLSPEFLRTMQKVREQDKQAVKASSSPSHRNAAAGRIHAPVNETDRLSGGLRK